MQGQGLEREKAKTGFPSQLLPLPSNCCSSSFKTSTNTAHTSAVGSSIIQDTHHAATANPAQE